MIYDIGTESVLTDREWIKGYLATLDSDGDTTHQTYEFLRDNRYENDGEEEELLTYRELCNQLGNEF